jgi:hypothetical protein
VIGLRFVGADSAIYARGPEIARTMAKHAIANKSPIVDRKSPSIRQSRNHY